MYSFRSCQSLDKLNTFEWQGLLRQALGQGVHQRREETFLFAREALRLALCDLHYRPDISELILTTYDQVAAYPEITLSLSHAPGIGVAVAGLRKDYQSLGVDVEHADRNVKNEIIARIAHPQDESLRNIHIWCLKEAAFKCLSNSHKLQEAPLFTDIRITKDSWLHSPSGLTGPCEIRQEGSYLLGLACLPC